MIALVDCNNFYASCERVFSPKIKNKPVIVLSNNDGCVIARSNEAKSLGIKMGHPAFQIQYLIEKYNIPLDEYITRCEKQIAEWDEQRKNLEDKNQAMELCQSHEYAASIINGLENNKEVTINGNVSNKGFIENLPTNISVEVPCLINGKGIHPLKIGELPPHLSALMMTNINVQQLTVEAALSGKKEYIYHAAMLDPHTAAELSVDEIWNLVNDLLMAHGDMIPKFN